MGENNYLKIGAFVAFLLFAAVSCWATAESLHLLLPSWPVALCWIVTVGFFFIASWGSKLIVDSCNQTIFVEKRGMKLVIGIIILVIFWFVCSFPTNTHTFFYRSVIDEEVTKDISTTKGYLSQIANDAVINQKIQDRCTELDNQVRITLDELEQEMINEANPGHGKKTKEILRKFATILGVAKIEPLSGNGSTVQERQKLIDAYRSKILSMAESKKRNIKASMTPTSNAHKKAAETAIRNLDLTSKYIFNDKSLDLNNADDLMTVCQQLNNGYAVIRTYKDYVTFQTEEEKEHYTSPNSVTKVTRMKSVFDVWADYLTGAYAGRGFIFWIILAILVDVAAFIFFGIAFGKKE